MKTTHPLFGLAFLCLFALSACGKATASTEPPSSKEEEVCEGTRCTEQDINAPVGPQPVEPPSRNYDQDPKNPLRSGLGFPPYSSSWGLKRAVYDKAVRYYEQNKARISNPRYFTIVDFNLHSSKKRLFLFDLSTGKVERHNVAAGLNSDPDNDGYATEFSNVEGSQKSSLGFYETGSTYIGGHGLSLYLHGLSSTNSNAEKRAIVMHPADYVSDGDSRAGRSWGCPAIDPRISEGLIGKVKNGSILLIDR